MMQGARTRKGSRTATAAAFVVIAAACGTNNTSAEPTTALSIESTTTTAPTTTTSRQVTTTTTGPTTSTEPVEQGSVGSPALLMETIEGAVASIEIIYPDLTLEDVPIPDVHTGDPVEALEELFAFDRWATENYPADEWAPVIADDRSQAEGIYRRFWDSLLWTIRARWVGFSDGYYIETEIESLPDLGLDEDVIAAVPDGSIGIRFLAGGDGYAVTHLETDEVIEEVRPWSTSGIIVVAPTDEGWQLWLAEGTE